MVRPLSTDFRARLVGAVERDGISARAAAARFGVSASSAVKWVRRHRATGSVAPDRIGGYKPRLLTGALRSWLPDRAKRDFTRRGLVAELAEQGVTVDDVQVWRFAHAGGLSFKKSVLPAGQLRPRVARRREQWKTFQHRPDPRRLVFVDGSEAEAEGDKPGRRPTWPRCEAGPRSARGSTPRCPAAIGRR